MIRDQYADPVHLTYDLRQEKAQLATHAVS